MFWLFIRAQKYKKYLTKGNGKPRRILAAFTACERNYNDAIL
jgi:hypothetical protein